MARDCKDGKIIAGPLTGTGYLWARHFTNPYPNGYRFFAKRTAWSQAELTRFQDGTSTKIASTWVTSALPTTSFLEAIGDSLTGGHDAGTPVTVTDTVLADAGDWYVQYQPEASFECYDAPAPSGPKHRVIGSGIVNSRAIVRGGNAW